MKRTIRKEARRQWVRAAASLLTLGAGASIAGGIGAALAAGAGRPAAPASANAAGNGAALRTLLVLGDSLSAEYGLARGTGWVALLEKRLAERAPGWNVVNASISGETTAGGATRISSLLEKHEPAAVVVELGGNDALRGLDLNATRRNLERMVGASQKAGAKVLLLGMQVPPNYGKAYTDAFAQIFVDVAKAHRTPLVPFFLEGVADDMALFQPDRIHPNGQAQPRMLENVWPALEPLLRAARR
ncbi:arylesterase [Burkholderiaceae bacterium FT117]|uniref:arylesterase n=1 Tax=Zeimonas sediminis TaxID=2944268 RepID=UPI0023430706|nr:arylesterase [Zeimonas sediminis]MCM5569075.1 arylesterase [Zeimonas sediminis]